MNGENEAPDPIVLICACSGLCDVGAVADLAARKLALEGDGKPICLAAIAVGAPSVLKTAESANAILVIDGCPVACGQKIFDQAGFEGYTYLCLSEIGMTKGACPPSDHNISRTMDAARKLLAQE